MPNLVRNKIFTEFAMESARDSIKYLKPILTKTQNGKDLNNRATDPDANDGDPYGYDDQDFSNEARKYHKALYETTEDRYVQELINVAATENLLTVDFTDPENPIVTGATGRANFYGTDAEPTAFGVNGEKLISGYGVVYFGDETHPVAIQYKTNNEWITCAPFDGVKVEQKLDNGKVYIELDFTGLTDAAKKEVAKIAADLEAKGTAAKVRAFGRADLEDDFEGDYLGEVELRMSSYEFRPRPTAIGVTWSQLSEITLDTSFSVSAEEELVTYAAQEIRVALDYKAIRLGYQQALRNGNNYVVKFNAAVGSADEGINSFGYKQNAQTFTSAISKLEDVMLNDINRGGVSRLVAGPAAGSYCFLLDSYRADGAQPNIGAHQVGTIINGIPLFKVPSSIIPNNRMLTVFKNEANEADVSLVFGTLVPFYSTGTIVRKNLYKEAAIASYGDWNCLNPKYLGIIEINGLKDAANN
jgi:hypothetical protein